MAEEKGRNSEKGQGKGEKLLARLVLDLGKILPKVSSSTSFSPDDPSRTSGCNTNKVKRTTHAWEWGLTPKSSELITAEETTCICMAII